MNVTSCQLVVQKCWISRHTNLTLWLLWADTNPRCKMHTLGWKGCSAAAGIRQRQRLVQLRVLLRLVGGIQRVRARASASCTCCHVVRLPLLACSV